MKPKTIQSKELISIRAKIKRDFKNFRGFDLTNNSAYLKASLRLDDQDFDKDYLAALTECRLLDYLIEKCKMR